MGKIHAAEGHRLTVCRRPPGAARVVPMLWLLLIAGLAGAAESAGPALAAIASAHPAATAAGRQIIDAGGNAFDAAVAVAATLAVVEPYASGLGGGGFFLLYRADDGRRVTIDARERAPRAAHASMYLDSAGGLVPEHSLDGPLAAGVPGLPAGLAHLSRAYGRLSLAAALAPAVRWARAGFPVTEHYRQSAEFRAGVLSRAPAAAAIFLRDGAAPVLGQVVVQEDLAATLERLGAQGPEGFYAGPVARALVAGMRAAGGIWTAQDLAEYRIVERDPIAGSYRGMRIFSAPPPSSGGVVLVEALNILERYDLDGFAAGRRRHVMIEAMRRAYRDRAAYLGDPDYTAIPLARLLSKDYAREQCATLSLEKATPSASLPGVAGAEEGRDTTHFSILDAEGNRVAATLSINYPFGAAFVPPGTGVLLNNEMDDFSAQPLTPNVYGLVGGAANAIAPGKRPLSSMAPTFLESDARVGILGTPGGSRIVSMVLIGTLEFVAGKMPIDWVAAKRFHHQYLPDEVEFERAGLTAAEQADLVARGHVLREVPRTYGNMHAILRAADGAVVAASDPRGEGQAVVWQPRAPVRRPAASVGSAGNKSSTAVQ